MITAQLATIPGREESVKKTIDSLEKQVDIMSVRNGDLRLSQYGDAEKFNGLDRFRGYLFTCDDDLLYPPDYCQTLIKKIEQYGRKALITCHGRTFPKREIKSYYRDKLEGFRCLGTVERDVQVDSGGTGVMAWHSDLWRPSMDWFKEPNMADVFIAVEAMKRNIPIICIEHQEGWIDGTPEGWTYTGIWDVAHNDDGLQTYYFNEEWTKRF